jgi:Family of unknown function (DUF5825)
MARTGTVIASPGDPMRTVADSGARRPAAVTVHADELMADPSHAVRLVAEAGARSLTLLGPVRLGTDPDLDVVVLRLLAEATAGQVDLRWELGGEPPWPLRTVVHLRPPTGAANAAGRRFATRWGELFRFGLCTYRRGPDFIAVRDVRPDGERLRTVADGRWATAFETLLSTPTCPAGEAASRQLLDELFTAGLALRLGAGRHALLPFRLRRWPIPYSAV